MNSTNQIYLTVEASCSFKKSGGTVNHIASSCKQIKNLYDFSTKYLKNYIMNEQNHK